MYSERIVTGGRPLTTATHILPMLHGRGGSAQDTLSAQYLDVADFSVLAPQAPGHSCYPNSVVLREPPCYSTGERCPDTKIFQDPVPQEIRDSQAQPESCKARTHTGSGESTI